ncbi:MAG: hypothetical protein ABI390_10215 [Daejeonella sp.]
MKVNVLIIEKNPILTLRVGELLKDLSEVERVLVADTFQKALTILDHNLVHIVSLGIQISDKNILELLSVCNYDQHCELFILSDNYHDNYKARYELLGIKYWLDKAKDFDMIPQLISQISASMIVN